MVANTGSYIEGPFHRFETGKDLSEVSLESFTDLEAIVVHVPPVQTLEIIKEHFRNHEIRNRAILVHTGWDKHWNTGLYYENHPVPNQRGG